MDNSEGEEEKHLLNKLEVISQTTYKPLFQIYDLRIMKYDEIIRAV
jgi:hypothetical protein